jgi:hypothetical protein
MLDDLRERSADHGAGPAGFRDREVFVEAIDSHVFGLDVHVSRDKRGHSHRCPNAAGTCGRFVAGVPDAAHSGAKLSDGVAASMSGALNEMVRLVGEVGLSINQDTSSNLNGTLTLYHYGVGPRFTANAGRVLPYVQVLVGGVHARADLTQAGAPFSSSGNAFMLQPGAGVIVPMTRTFAAIGAMNYRRVFFKNDPDNQTSVFAGVRIAFR